MQTGKAMSAGMAFKRRYIENIKRSWTVNLISEFSYKSKLDKRTGGKGYNSYVTHYDKYRHKTVEQNHHNLRSFIVQKYYGLMELFMFHNEIMYFHIQVCIK